MQKLYWVTIATTVMLLGGTASAADDRDDLEHFEKRAEQINQASKEPGMMKIALKTISNETGVPLDQVRDQHKRHPDLGTAALLLANVMAAETKKSPDHFIAQRKEGKNWRDMARQNKVPIDKLNVRLDNLKRALTSAKEKK